MFGCKAIWDKTQAQDTSVCSTAKALVVPVGSSCSQFAFWALEPWWALWVWVCMITSWVSVFAFISSEKIELSCRGCNMYRATPEYICVCLCVCYLLKSLVELALLEELQDVCLLCLVVEVCCGDGCAGRWPHRLHDTGGDHRLLLLHCKAHLPFDNSLHMAKNRLLQTEEDMDRRKNMRTERGFILHIVCFWTDGSVETQRAYVLRLSLKSEGILSFNHFLLV